MNIKENIDKISWSFLDKITVVIYGFITLIQIKFMEPTEYGIFYSLIALVNYFLSISDSLALQGIIQFGQKKEERENISKLAIILNILVLTVIPVLILISQNLYSDWIKSNYFYQIVLFLPILTTLSNPRLFVLKSLTRDLRFKDFFFLNFSFYFVLTIATLFGIFYYKQLTMQYLVGSYIISNIVSGAYAYLVGRNYFKFKNKGEINLKKYLSFTIPATLITIFHAIPKTLDIFVIALFLKSTETAALIGVYSSAKTLFRIFDQALDASYGLIYPTAVKHVSAGNKDKVQQLFSKAVSFILLLFVVAFLSLNFGLTNLIISYLPAKYIQAEAFFNVLLYAILVSPFSLLAILINADNKPKITFYIVFVASVLSMVTFAVAAHNNLIYILPLGIVVYNLILGLGSYIYAKLHYGFPIKLIFRSILDTKNYLKSFTK